jgi:hypothetical protein
MIRNLETSRLSPGKWTASGLAPEPWGFTQRFWGYGSTRGQAVAALESRLASRMPKRLRERYGLSGERRIVP